MNGSGGHFGAWAVDDDGGTCFDLDVDPKDPSLVLPRGGAGRIWHQVGNDAFTTTAHADGSVTLYSCEAGVVRLGTGSGASTTASGTDAPSRLRARWGTGYAQWTAPAGIVRRVWAPFGDLTAVRVDVVATAGAVPWHEIWTFDPLPIVLGGLMSRRVPAPSTHDLSQRVKWDAIFAATAASRSLTDGLRRILGARLALARVPADEEDAPGVVILAAAGKAGEKPSKPSPLARIPGRVFVAPLGGDDIEVETTEQRTAVTVRVGASVEPGRPLSIGIGLAAAGLVADAVDTLREAAPEDTSARWRRVFSFDAAAAPTESREAGWHAAMLRSSQVRDAVLDCRYAPQGSAYGFVHGLQGAPRDYAFTMVPLVHIDPAGARDLLRLMFAMQRDDGALQYAHTGSGYVTGAGIHDVPSDLPLALCWAATEYVWATGDAVMVEAAVPRVVAAWRRLRDGVGFGAHGLLRVGSGDWNDPISAFVEDRRAFHRRGESVYNSAFAAHVLPRAAALVEDADPHCASEMREAAVSLAAAVETTWTGKWFLRGYDGRGGPIGEDRLFLDANAWCLVSALGSTADRRCLVDSIEARCAASSPIGATILDRPMDVRGGILADGWDTNAGVWAAIGGLLVRGMASVDPTAAWRELHKQTFSAHAAAYPNVWYGVWSGPDAYNSHHGDRPGETFVQPATPMTEFPVMNSNADSGPLLGLLGALGVEATPDGIRVEPRVPDGFGKWTLRTALVEAQGDGAWVESIHKQ